MAQGNIQESMNRFLTQYLPMLVQQQQQRKNWDYQQDQRKEYSDYSMEGYLKRRLAEMAQGEEYDIAGDERTRIMTMMNNLFGDFTSAAQEEVKGMPYASSQFAERTAPAAKSVGLDPLPVSPTMGADTTKMAEIAQALAIAQGQGTMPPDEVILEAFKLFPIDTVREEVGKISDAALKRVDQLARQQEINIKGYEADTSRLKEITGAKTQEGKANEDAVKGWVAMVKDVEDHIRMEGVSINKDKKEQMEVMKIFAFSGRFPDPLSAETRGKVFSVLGGIRGRLIDGVLPTAAEKEFIAGARDTYRIEDRIEEGVEIKGEGLVDPTRTDEEASIDDAMVMEKMNEIREMTKNDVPPPTEEQIRALAVKWVGKLK